MRLRIRENSSISHISFVFNVLDELSSNIDEDFIPSDFRLVASNSHARVLDNLPGGYVILPPVPRTGNNFILECTLAQRTSPMQASIVDSIELTRYIGERYGLARNLNLVDGSWWNFGSLGGRHKRHVRSFMNEGE
jgi:hypothetical protein